MTSKKKFIEKNSIDSTITTSCGITVNFKRHAFKKHYFLVSYSVHVRVQYIWESSLPIHLPDQEVKSVSLRVVGDLRLGRGQGYVISLERLIIVANRCSD